MGHTFVAGFAPELTEQLNGIALRSGVKWNKIPFGRNCDREAADRVIDYHVTLYHWGDDADELRLRLLGDTRPPRCEVVFDSAVISPGREDSTVLLLTAQPGTGFTDMTRALGSRLQMEIPARWHMSIFSSMDPHEIEIAHAALESRLCFPFTLPILEYRLYYLWHPVRLVRTLTANEKTAL